MKDFGFTIHWAGPNQRFAEGDVGWSVDLPHQCDDWSITGPDYGPRVDRFAAIHAMTEFIKQAENIRDQLRAQPNERPEPYWLYPPKQNT